MSNITYIPDDGPEPDDEKCIIINRVDAVGRSEFIVRHVTTKGSYTTCRWITQSVLEALGEARRLHQSTGLPIYAVEALRSELERVG